MVTPSKLIAGRTFHLFVVGRVEITLAHDNHIGIHYGDHSLFVDNQILDVNQGDRPEPVVLPFLDAMQAVTVRRVG